MIIAEKNGHKKTFSTLAWKSLPSHKFEWKFIEDTEGKITPQPQKPAEIIERRVIPDIPQKKNVAVEVNEIVIPEINITELEPIDLPKKPRKDGRSKK